MPGSAITGTHDRHARVAWAALTLFLVLTALLVGAWQFVRHHERRAFEARLQVTSEQVALRLEAFLADRFGLIEEFGGRLEASTPPDQSTFERLSAEFQRRNGGFQALNWVSPEGVIQWTVPPEANAEARGFELNEHPIAGPAWRASRRTGSLASTRPLELLQGGWGFATYLPVRHDGETLGYLNGVFRIRALLDHCLIGEHDREYSYLLHDGEQLVGVHGPQFEQHDQAPGASRPVRVADSTWNLTVQGTADPALAPGARTAAALLFAGILLAALLAWMMQVARVRQRRGEVSAAKLAVLVENAPDAIVTIDPQTGCFVDCNPNATALFGLTPQELRSVGPGALSPGKQPDGRDSKAAMAEQLARAALGEAPHFDWVHLDAAGKEVPTVVQLIRLPNTDRELVRGSIVDVRDKRALEERLLSAQKMEAMGRLAGGVAHDFNNLLTAILGASELIALRVRDDEELTRLSGEIAHTCERAGALTRQLLAFSRSQIVKRAPIDLSEVVREMLPMMERILGKHVRVRTDLDPTPFAVLADHGQMELAVLNLAINARDAMITSGAATGGDTLTIATHTHTSAESGRRVLLDVIDQGTGIAASDLDHIFEPFFTGKLPGAGTGLGLATVKQIVTEAGGSIRVRTQEGHGSTFTIDLPGIVTRAPEPLRPTPAPEVLGGAGTVLLVDDDASVRAVARLSLERAGYRVLESATAEQALVQASEFPDPIDVLVTDVVLPGIPGTELVSQLAVTRPETVMLLISGYSETSFDASGTLGEKLELLSKPFSPSALTRKVGDLLAARARRLAPGAGSPDPGA